MIKIINLFLVAFSFNVYAISVNNISFETVQSCPGYQSKNTGSNPDGLMTIPGKTYQVREINKPSPDWVRIEFMEQHSLRWVSTRCGTLQQSDRATNSCNNAGMADSYVLAMSLQPGFCETYGFEAGKIECRKLSKESYQAKHLTLHGLWPNQDTCGQHYGFCGVRQRSNHCDYDSLSLSPEVSQQLKKIMPSYFYGSCLERHEWNKHGTCQILSEDEYFSLAIRLTTEVDTSVFGQYLTEHAGQTVKLSVLRELLGSSFGKNNIGKVYLGCKNGTLVDIFMQLPALMPFSESVANLIDKAPDVHYRDYCPQIVKLSNFNKETWY